METNHNEKLKLLSKLLGEFSYIAPFPESIFYCPNCKHHKKKLGIHLDKNVYKCWVCGDNFSGNVLYLFKKYGREDLASEYKKLNGLQITADTDIKALLNNVFTSENKELENYQVVDLPKEVKNIEFEGIINPYKNYLFSRGINKFLIKKYNIKYVSEGYYRNRIIIPSFDSNGNVNYFVARSIYKEDKRYLNPNIDKNAIIFNEVFVDWNRPIILVEGVVDAIKVDYNSIPLLGSTIEKSLIKDRILKYKPKVYVMLDQDARSKQLKIISTLMKWGIEVYDVVIDKKDPGCMTKKEIFENIKKASLITYESIIKSKIQEV